MKSYQKVFITGNSLTAGFGTHGMAATSVETDWVYWVKKGLQEANPNVEVDRILSNVGWESELTSESRKAVFDRYFAPHVDEKTDLVLLQLGDNVNIPEKRTTFRKDAADLVRYFRAAAPNARVIWIYGWYNMEDNMDLLEGAMADVHCELADITGPAPFTENRNKIGGHYVNPQGEDAVITGEGVASHPGDLGMKKIAEIVLETIANGQ